MIISIQIKLFLPGEVKGKVVFHVLLEASPDFAEIVVLGFDVESFVVAWLVACAAEELILVQ